VTRKEPIIVEARFAGGDLEVSEGHLTWEPDKQLVVLDAPGGYAIPLFPHEARALADALRAAADTAETKEKRLRRPRTVDDQLVALDNE
jgi:hypothetical protein